MTGLAKRTESKGFIVRKSDPKDDRVTLLAITQKGRDTLKEIENEKNRSIDKILEGIPLETKKELLHTITSIIKSTGMLQREISGLTQSEKTTAKTF